MSFPDVRSRACPPITVSGATTCLRAVRNACTRRRSQRIALGSVTSSPRSASAAASMLLADEAMMTLSSIDPSRPGIRAARKSGSRLNVRRPCGQYHRAIRSPRGVARA